MKLIKAQIQNFRSAEDTGEFSLDQVTCLVGKNEAGKSAVLLALAALNPHPRTPIVLDKERDYPRRYLTNYSARHPSGDAIAVTTIWQLEDVELQAVRDEFGEGVLPEGTAKIFRRYGGNPEWSFSINFDAVFDHLFGVFKLSAAERAPLKSAKNSQSLIKTLKEMGTPTEKHQALRAQMEKYGSVTGAVQKILEGYLPKLMYFSNYDRMDGAIQIEQMKELIANKQIELEQYRGQKLFAEFLEYAGVPLNEITGIKTYETFNARLEAASNNITDQILEYWTQNPDLSV